MLLREDHIAVFQANWNDKATNIKAIAEELALGLDAMVFLDDNPSERGLVRRLLPQVAVPELPDDPSLYPRVLMAAGYFEAVTFSAEDRQRADFYRDNARRIALQKQAGDVEAYLASLKMVIRFRPFDVVGRARITQLINKSNQFNLTTRRYTEAEVQEMGSDPDCYTLQVSLADIYGDNGMISVVICRRQDSDWRIDTWLMSCRVLGRRVENAILRELIAAARERGITRIIGAYRPTPRNKMVEDHYPKLGFSPLCQNTDGSTDWELNLARTADTEAPIPMTVERSGFDLAATDYGRLRPVRVLPRRQAGGVLGALRTAKILLVAVSLAIVAAGARVVAQPQNTGPTPYPQNEKDWPGVGVIRVFGFMTGERQAIWSQRQANQGAVVFVGDSNIGGWKSLRQDFAPLDVVNAGVGGDVSRGVLFRLREDVIDFHPRAVVILVGFNDLSAEEKIADYMANMKSILRLLLGYDHRLPIVICTLPPGDREPSAPDVSRADREALNARLDSLKGVAPNLVILDLFRLLARPNGLPDPADFYQDGIHLSMAGYRKLRDGLVRVFHRLRVE
jgi:FkbH-like protein